MQLEPRQLSTLDEMGIPVWELRNKLISATAAIPAALDERQVNSAWLIFHDSENHTEQKQQLLVAMMASIDVEINATAVVRHEQFLSLKSQALENKLLFVFGKRFRTEFLPKQKSSNEMTAEVHGLNDSGLNMVIIDDLSDLIQYPEKKQLAWQTLKCAKATVKRFN